MRPLLALVVLSGCSSILGISDPVAGTPGDDDIVDAPPIDPDTGDAGPRTLVSVSISPDPLALPLGKQLQLQLIGNFSDSSTENLTGQATFALDTGTAVSISPAGVIRGLAQGQATVKATFETFEDSLDASVGPPAADHLLLSLGNISIKQQQRVQVHAIVVFTDGSTQDGTNSVTWTSSDDNVATVVTGRVDAQLASGDATITASATGVQPVSLLASVGIIVCHPIINEVQSGSSASASDEWAEIYNPCTVPIDVTNFTLNYRASTATGATDTNGLITLVGTMAPGEIRVFGGNGVPVTEVLDDNWGGGVMQQNSGALALRNGPKDTGPIVDAMAYGSISAGHPFIEGTPAPGLVNGTTVSRLPFDGNDTNDGGTNFQVTALSTPHVLNAP